MTEAELIQQMEELLAQKKLVKNKLTYAQKQVVDFESQLIEISLTYERLKEQLRVFKKTNPIQEPTIYDKEIATFREKYPELVAWAKDRDDEKFQGR